MKNLLFSLDFMTQGVAKYIIITLPQRGSGQLNKQTGQNGSEWDFG
jgi:hypothetical protein